MPPSAICQRLTPWRIDSTPGGRAEFPTYKSFATTTTTGLLHLLTCTSSPHGDVGELPVISDRHRFYSPFFDQFPTVVTLLTLGTLVSGHHHHHHHHSYPYQYSYSTGPGHEVAQHFREESRDAFGNVIGKYGYVDPYGKLRCDRGAKLTRT